MRHLLEKYLGQDLKKLFKSTLVERKRITKFV